jgi:hypothetical protein
LKCVGSILGFRNSIALSGTIFRRGNLKTWLDPAGNLHRAAQAGGTDIWGPLRRLPAATRSLRRYLSPSLDSFPGPALHCHTHSARSRQPQTPRSSPAATPDPRREAGSHGRRGGRRRWDGRRPEAAHVRGRVSDLPFPHLLPCSSPIGCLPACLPARSRTRDLLVSRRASGFGRLLSPPGFCVLGCSVVCPTGSRVDREAGAVWFCARGRMCSRSWEHHVLGLTCPMWFLVLYLLWVALAGFCAEFRACRACAL